MDMKRDVPRSRTRSKTKVVAPGATGCDPGGVYMRVGGEWRGVDPAVPLAILREQGIGIPPAYDPAWVCRSPGRVVAAGIDAKGRKQVMYSSEAVREREERKRQHLASNIRCVPEAVAKMRAHLRRASPSRPKPEDIMTLATVILHDTGIRLGKEDHLVAGDSHGLSTLHCRHVVVDDAGAVTFRFEGKHKVENTVVLEDPDVRRWVAALAAQRCGGNDGDADGVRFFGAGAGSTSNTWTMHHRTFSRWLAKKLGPSCAMTPKEFRTIVANRIFAEAVRDGATAKDAVAETARRLNNTPAVVRKSYILEDVMLAVETARSPDAVARQIKRVGVDAFLEACVSDGDVDVSVKLSAARTSARTSTKQSKPSQKSGPVMA